MKKMRALVSGIVLLLLLSSCSLLGDVGTRATTEPPKTGADAVADLTSLMNASRPTRATAEMTCLDTAHKVTLTADATLILDTSGEEALLSYLYSYELLNPAGSDKMTSIVEGSRTGTLAQVSPWLTGLFGWIADDREIALATLDISADCLSSIVTEGEQTTVAVKDGSIPTVFASDLGGASGLTLTVTREGARIVGMHMTYTAGDCAYTVQITYTYQTETVPET